MKRQSLLTAALTTTLIAAGCATAPPYNPFKIAEEEFHGKIKTIALAPVGVPGDLGDPDPVKAEFESLMEAKFKADAVLYPGISLGVASFAGGSASWGGTSESLAMTEGFFGQLQVGNLRGTTRALSLIVTIENIHGGDVYVNMGGIQLAAKISGGQFVPVPRNQLFANQERNAAAVNTALGPLVRNAAPAGT